MTDAVADNYRTTGLLDRILAALAAAGIDPDHPTIDDLAAVDEFHSRRRRATEELAALLAAAKERGGDARAAQIAVVQEALAQAQADLAEVTNLIREQLPAAPAPAAGGEVERRLQALEADQRTAAQIEDLRAFNERVIDSLVSGLVTIDLDGRVLSDPANKQAKIRSKDRLLREVLGYEPHTLVSIEYLPDLGDWKTAWDHIRFAGLEANVKLRVALAGRKNYTGVLQGLVSGEADSPDAKLGLVFEAADGSKAMLEFTLAEVDKTRLVPVIDFKGRKS